MVAVLFCTQGSGDRAPAPGLPEVAIPPAVAYYLMDLAEFPAHQRVADFDEYDETLVEPAELQLLLHEHRSLRERINARALQTPPSWVLDEWRGPWRELAEFLPADSREARNRADCQSFGWEGLMQLVDDIHRVAEAGLRDGHPVIIAGD